MSRKGRGGGSGSDDLPGEEGASTATFGTVQDGYSRTNTIWDESRTYNGDAGETECWYGFVFDVSSLYSTESERGLALEPPIINYMELTLNRVGAAVSTAGEAYVFFVPSFTQIAYAAGASNPSRWSEWLIGYTNTASVFTGTTLTIPIGDDDSIISSLPTRSYFVAPSNTAVNGSDTGDLIANFGRFQGYVRNSQWDGTFALSVYLTVTGGDVQMWSSRGSGTVPGLNVTTHGFHSGQQGLPLRRRARVRHDPKSGFPGLSDEFIKDGYREGMMVLPESWDPEDRTGQDFYPPPSEGVVDDEVP
jgi:hypothetical protein